MKRAFLTTIFAAFVLSSLSFAAEPTTAPATQPADAVNRFYGTISAVDAAKKTFTVDNQTYTIVAETQLTKAADGAPATFADVVVGEPARGTFTKASDGTLHVTKVRFGKKAGGKAGGGGGKAGGGKKNAEAATKPA